MLPSYKDLAAIMGMPSKSTVTNILKMDQNIQPDQWEKFKKHFRIEEPGKNSQNSEQEPTMREIIAGLTTGFAAIAQTMRSMEEKMALESSLQEALAVVETISDRQEPAIRKILADLDELKRRKNDP